VKLQVLRIQATFPIKHMKHLSKDTYFHMYNKKCHIVAFLHSEKAKNIYFLFLVFKKTKNKFLGEKGRK